MFPNMKFISSLGEHLIKIHGVHYCQKGKMDIQFNNITNNDVEDTTIMTEFAAPKVIFCQVFIIFLVF